MREMLSQVSIEYVCLRSSQIDVLQVLLGAPHQKIKSGNIRHIYREVV
jgi:hypothetical protein